MKEILLTQGKVALVDDEDYEYLNQWKWHAYKCRNTYYAGRNSSRKNPPKRIIQMHRIILGLTDGNILIDHQDHNGLNNQRNNLRKATKAQNQQNSLSFRKSTSIYKGVVKHKNHGKWQAQIAKEGKHFYLGVFNTQKDAAIAYNTAAKELHGEFAALNEV